MLQCAHVNDAVCRGPWPKADILTLSSCLVVLAHHTALKEAELQSRLRNRYGNQFFFPKLCISHTWTHAAPCCRISTPVLRKVYKKALSPIQCSVLFSHMIRDVNKLVAGYVLVQARQSVHVHDLAINLRQAQAQC